jgi:Putative Ig domain/Pentapeptide repeats (8 copies)
MPRSIRRIAGMIVLAALLAGSVLVLVPAQAQAKTRDCTPRPAADLAHCDYSNANLYNADFAGSDLAGANLSGANLNAANFGNANLRFADLQGAGIVFDCPTVVGGCPIVVSGGIPLIVEFEVSPNFADANLHGANLEGVTLGGQSFAGPPVCLPAHPCLPTEEVYPDAVLFGVRSGAISGTPASLPSGWELIDGFLAPIIPSPQITTTSLPAGTLDSPYSAGLTASGGNPPYTWSVVGSLPPGLHVHKSLGTITGEPQASGTYSFTVVVTDSKTAAQPHTQRTGTQPLSITVP